MWMKGINIENTGTELEFVSYNLVDNHLDKPLVLKDSNPRILLTRKEIKPMIHKF